MNKILIVEDDPVTLDTISTYMKIMNYNVFCANNAASAWKIVCCAALDCMILDINLPDEDGFSLCARLRERSELPIIFLSGYTDEESRIKGFWSGGDDYVCKPYSLEELELRVRSRIRGSWALRQPEIVTFDALTINPLMRTLDYNGVFADLSAYEFDVLYFMALHPHEVFSYEQLFSHVWHAPLNKSIKSLQMIIVRLRQKLAELRPEHDYIQTVRRKGYFFSP